DSLGNIIGEDIEDQWSPRSNASLTAKPAYPNPASSMFAVELELQQSDTLTFEVLDRPGHIIITLLKSSFDSGRHKFQIQPDTFDPPLQSGKIFQIKISSSDIEVYGNIKYQE
ncbi:MAG: hypothetical protein R3345_14270, partial [Fulvivirga sp.]|nr:hypothetical protein [Fulvivirga sp.]